MYVIEANIRAGNITNAGLVANNIYYLPADRCFWQQGEVDNGYVISDVHYNSGLAAGGTTGPITLAGGTGVTENLFRLGYIGKSGRFVAITN